MAFTGSILLMDPHPSQQHAGLHFVTHYCPIISARNSENFNWMLLVIWWILINQSGERRSYSNLQKNTWHWHQICRFGQFLFDSNCQCRVVLWFLGRLVSCTCATNLVNKIHIFKLEATGNRLFTYFRFEWKLYLLNKSRKHWANGSCVSC